MAAITCADCGATRKNAMYKNTLYCFQCRMLRDVAFLQDREAECAGCGHQFALITRRDRYCGQCAVGCGYRGDCALCRWEDSELYRPGVPVCIVCVRDPAMRVRLVRALQSGQRMRREANGIAASGPPRRRPRDAAIQQPIAQLLITPDLRALLKRLMPAHPRPHGESMPAYAQRLVAEAVLTADYKEA